MGGTVDRLQAMLRQVDPSLQAGGLRQSPDSSPGSGLETHAAGAVDSEAQLAVESLDVLRRGDVIDEENRFGLEAIVMPFFRPVIDIVGNAMTLPQLSNKWSHLGKDAVRARIEKTFLSIGCLELPGHPSLPYAGTGFVVGRYAGGGHLLMTNRHVAELFASGLGAKNLNFVAGQKVELDFFRENGSSATDRLHVERVLMIHPYWDMALLEVSGLPANREPLQLLTEDPGSLKDREVVTVGYPGYDPTGDAVYQQTLARVFRGIYYVKRMQPGIFRSREDAKSFGRLVSAVTHDCSTLGGNSGSAVIDVTTGAVVGLHFAGAYLHANYAVSPHDLAQDARVVDTGINFSKSLTSSSFYTPYWQSADQGEAEPALANVDPPHGVNIQSPAGPTPGTPQKPHVDPVATTKPGSSMPGSSTVEIEVPLKVTVSIDSSKITTFSGAAMVAGEGGAALARGPSDQENVAATGFDVDFLSTQVALPELRALDLNDSVRVNNSHLIHHTHFSVCQSTSRRLPRFVAWNIDGNELRSISRRGLDFKFDTQVPNEFQVGDQLYKNNDYDRGHVARRADLLWGSTAEAKQANRESFFFTNITPQHKRFNQSGLAGLWGQLENAIYEDVDVHDLRISVIAGSIFKADDPVYRSVRIPRDYWKLLAFTDDADGKFKVAAYILSQRDMMLTEALELDAFQLHQVSLAQLSAETGLGFSQLAAYDIFGPATEGPSFRQGPTGQRREIGSRDQLLAWSVAPAAVAEAPAPSSRRSAPLFELASLEAPGFSWRAAHVLAYCSQLSYEPADSVRHIAINNWGFNTARFIEVGDMQCFVATTPQAIVVSFRGTENVADWITNLTLFSTSRSYGSVHRGFAKAFDLVKTAVRAEITNIGVGARKLLLTGHSLGGALATIAAAELQDLGVHGVYTYGQPRLGKADFHNFISSRYAGRFHRIVNDDDIGTRVPPGYEHVGQLYHLNADGGLIESMREAVGGSAEPRPLTELEFEALQKSIRAAQVAARANLETVDEREVVNATAEGLLPSFLETIEGREVVNATTEGFFPSFDDHKIARYLAKIRRLALNESGTRAAVTRSTATAESFVLPDAVTRWSRANKIDPELETLTQDVLAQGSRNGGRASDVRATLDGAVEGPAGVEGPEEGGIAEPAAAREALGTPVLLRLSNPDWVAPAGMTIQSRIGSFATAHCTASQLHQLRDDPGVLAVEASRDAGMPEVARSLPFIGATDVHKPPLSEKGSDAIVGLIDSGIDILHEAFLDDVGKTRILGIWNQRETAQPGSRFKSPKDTLPGVLTQDYGVLYLQNEIQAFLGDPTAVPQILRDPDGPGGPGHGTHVASIAAGREVGAFKGGVAPEAKILVVIPNMVTNASDPPSLGYSNSHVDALSFLIAASKAAEIGKGLPIAINVSLGMNAGAHDGQSLLEASFDAATLNGREPGVVIVKSAGNEGNSGGHAELPAFNGTQTITWKSAAIDRPRDYIEVWYRSQHELEFVLIDPAGKESTKISAADRTGSIAGSVNRCTLLLTEFHPESGDHRLQIKIEPDAARIQAGTWRLNVTGLAVGGGDQSIHAWVERDIARAVRFQTGDSNAMTLSVPGTAKHVITVTASGSELPLLLTPSSSQGLTRDGRSKPDLCAPGTQVIAAASASADPTAVVAMTGTSMAAPHVTGVVALALSMRKKLGSPQLTANSAAAMLKKFASSGNGAHNRMFGFGCLGAKQFLDAVKKL